MTTEYFEITPDTDFLILDLREPIDFQNYRIKEGKTTIIVYVPLLDCSC
jgi:hypothetical protein